MFIDTHAHIYSEEFKDDLENMLENAAIGGITDIYMPNIDSTSIEEMMRISQKHKNCHAMMGLHPCYVKENFKAEMATVEKYLSQHTFAGVGEIGIDLYWDKTYAIEQEIVFRRQIALAKEHGLPFVIHSRDSLDMTIDIVTELQDGSLSGIFHCFNGTLDQGKRIMDTGFLMGIGGVVTYKNAGVDKVAAEIPMEYLVLETDAPYLSPVPYRGKRNECAYISVIAEKLAEIKGLTKSETGAMTTFNANKLFKITP